MADWKITIYGTYPNDEDGILGPNQVLAHWIAEGSEAEALQEASDEVDDIGNHRVSDWTMEEVCS